MLRWDGGGVGEHIALLFRRLLLLLMTLVLMSLLLLLLLLQQECPTGISPCTPRSYPPPPLSNTALPCPQQVWHRLFYAAHLHLLAWLFHSTCSGWFCRTIAFLAVLAESALPVSIIFDHQFSRLKRRLFDATLALQGAPQPAAADAADTAALQHALGERRRQRHAQRQQQRGAGVGVGIGAGHAVSEVVFRVGRKLVFPEPGESKLIKLARCVAVAVWDIFSLSIFIQPVVWLF